MANPTSPPKQPAETLRQAGYLVEHCKKLVDVVVSLYPPLHSYTCSVKIFLFLFTLRKLDLQRHGLPGNQRIVSSAIEKLKEELSALLAEIRCSAFEPLELTTLENLKLYV
ncbi:uncharacterized protein LOC113215909 [Frankliniella occidentalis]|uniref:Uncharacterized protein LOC113215909 n=1 Tax=Frankliniella occidentalis TaxID=133901 RepID=A0A9C6WS46_FRAOC|nr:uncharacterized protein LOC113215909 [Frankliniella occidentalis]